MVSSFSGTPLSMDSTIGDVFVGAESDMPSQIEERNGGTAGVEGAGARTSSLSMSDR